MKYTIDELVARVKPDYVSVNNPQTPDKKTPGNAIVSSFHVDCDPVDGLMMYVNLEEDDCDFEFELEEENEIENQGPSTQYEIWEPGADHAYGYPLMITHDKSVADAHRAKGYEIRSYTAYPVI